jgi:polyvinyl alcohol dehydrogenase (cytochrome)
MRTLLIGIVLLLNAAFVAPSALSAQDGERLYKSNCASCHDGGLERAPLLSTLRLYFPERILEAIERGSMISMANRASTEDRRAIAEYVSGKKFSEALVTTPPLNAMCPVDVKEAVPLNGGLTGPIWSGWGKDTNNARFQAGEPDHSNDAQVETEWVSAFQGHFGKSQSPRNGCIFAGAERHDRRPECGDRRSLVSLSPASSPALLDRQRC